MSRSMSYSRRRIIRAGGMALIAAPYVWTSRARAQDQVLFVNTWGGSWTAAEESAYFKPFTAATGIKVRTVAPVSFAKLKAQVQTGTYESGRPALGFAEWTARQLTSPAIASIVHGFARAAARSRRRRG